MPTGPAGDRQGGPNGIWPVSAWSRVPRPLPDRLALFAVPAPPARADKKEAGLLSCQSKVAAKNDASGLPTCETKVSGKFSVAFAKAGVCTGVEATCESQADQCESNVASATTDTFPSRCETAKRKAAGQLANGEFGCYAKAAAKGIAVDPACIAKAVGKFGVALAKAGACPDGGSPKDLIENSCVKPSITADGGGTVTDVCPTTTTTSTTSTTTSTTSSTSTSTSSTTSTSTSTSSSTTTSSSTSTTTSTLVCGNFITKWGSLGSGDGQFSSAYVYGVAVDVSGDVYIADSNNDRVQKFDNAGMFITKWGSAGIANGQFDRPYQLAVDGSGNVYVMDSYNNRIQKFDAAGTFLTAWGVGGFGVAVDGSGNVFANSVQKFDSIGTLLTQWGSFGSGNGQFISPYHLAADASGNVYVADTGNSRIQKFDNVGTFLTKWGSPGSGDGQFNSPVGVAVDGSGNVYVTDELNYRVQKFDNTGTFVAQWGSNGNGDGQFINPTGVAVDGSGNVFVGDTGNYRIQKFGCP